MKPKFLYDFFRDTRDGITTMDLYKAGFKKGKTFRSLWYKYSKKVIKAAPEPKGGKSET